MALVQPKQHKVYKTKQSHSCQRRWLSVSHDTLVQEGNHLSHARYILQGDTHKISAHVMRTSMTVEQAGLPIDRLLGKVPTCHQVAKTLIKRPRRVEYSTLKGMTEVGFKQLLRQSSSTRQSDAPRHTHIPWHWLPEALPCQTEGFVCPAAQLGLEILPCKTLTTPLPPVLSPGPAD